MDSFLKYPTQIYDQIYFQWGWPGIMVAGLGLVLGVISIFIWWDRRK